MRLTPVNILMVTLAVAIGGTVLKTVLNMVGAQGVGSYIPGRSL
jgi:hypothetical protein